MQVVLFVAFGYIDLYCMLLHSLVYGTFFILLNLFISKKT